MAPPSHGIVGEPPQFFVTCSPLLRTEALSISIQLCATQPETVKSSSDGQTFTMGLCKTHSQFCTELSSWLESMQRDQSHIPMVLNNSEHVLLEFHSNWRNTEPHLVSCVRHKYLMRVGQGQLGNKQGHSSSIAVHVIIEPLDAPLQLHSDIALQTEI